VAVVELRGMQVGQQGVGGALCHVKVWGGDGRKNVACRLVRRVNRDKHIGTVVFGQLDRLDKHIVASVVVLPDGQVRRVGVFAGLVAGGPWPPGAARALRAWPS